MIGIDTNILVRYAVRDNRAQTAKVDRLVAGLSPDAPAFVGHVVLAELWWVLTQAYKFPRDQCCDFFDRLFAVREFTIERSDLAHEALRRARGGAEFPDALIAADANDAGCTVVETLDRTAAKRAGMHLLS